MSKEEATKKMSGLLITGVVLIPIIFTWFVLKGDYSKKAKKWSTIWLVLALVAAAKRASGQ